MQVHAQVSVVVGDVFLIGELIFVEFYNHVSRSGKFRFEARAIYRLIEYQIKFILGTQFIDYLFSLTETIWRREEWVSNYPE